MIRLCDRCGQKLPDDCLAIATVPIQPAYGREFKLVVSIGKQKFETTIVTDQDYCNIGHKGIPLGDPMYPCTITVTMKKDEA